MDFTAECWRSATEFSLSSIMAAMLGDLQAASSTKGDG